MAQDNGNSSMEMGTSDQVLVAAKKSKKTAYAIGFVAMLVAIGVVIALVVVLSGNDASPPRPEPIITTEGPTFPTTMPTTSTTTSTTTTTTTTEAPTTLPPPPGIELEDVINGEFSPPSFNGTWTSGNEILFRDSNGHLVLYDVDTDSPTTLISNDSQILQQSFRVTSLSPDGNYVVLSFNEISVYRHSFNARYAAIDFHTGQQIYIGPPGVAPENATLQNFVWGPTGTSLAFVYENNVFFQQSLTSQPQQLTSTGLENVVYHGVPDWVYEEEVFGSNNAIWFSSDGAKLAYATFNDTEVRVMKIPHFGVPGSVDYQYTSHREIHYPKSGTKNPTVSVTIRDIANNTDTTFNVPTDLTEPILKTVSFVGNDRIAVMWTNRNQISMRIDLCTEATPTAAATCDAIFRHTESDGWIDNIPLLFNTQGNAFITILPAAVGGVRYKQIVQVSQSATGPWSLSNRINTAHTVAEILLWTDEDVIWYKATGITDRTEQHIYTVNSTGVVTCFTCDIRRPDGKPCLYNDAVISPGSRVSINCGGPDIPQILIYDKNGTLLSVWDDNSRVTDLLASLTVPVTVHHTFRGGAIQRDVMIQAPADYADRTNLPLLVYVYAGPDTAMVTKQWTLDWGTSLVSRYGIVVVRIDGRGSGLQGVDNMFAVNRKLGTVEIEDQIAVTRILQQNMWLDSNRTCIWGWSYGGYAASLALARGGDAFRCAIAVAPVVDWRYYDTIYTERYMDTPQANVEGYANSSLLTEQVVEAYRNKSYLLVHGTEDDNVHYQHAMLFSRLLQRRDVYFHQMSYTDEDHSLGGVRPHLYHALEKFLRENMF